MMWTELNTKELLNLSTIELIWNDKCIVKYIKKNRDYLYKEIFDTEAQAQARYQEVKEMLLNNK